MSSICDFDIDELTEDLDKHPRCPICAERIEQEFWDKFQDDISHRRMNLRLQEKFCQAHKSRTADDAWLDRGYPKIDWSVLRSRLDAHQNHIHAVLDGDFESPYYKQHAKIVTDIKNRSNTSAAASGRFTGLRAGYYGTKGEKIMYVSNKPTTSQSIPNPNQGRKHHPDLLRQTSFPIQDRPTHGIWWCIRRCIRLRARHPSTRNGSRAHNGGHELRQRQGRNDPDRQRRYRRVVQRRRRRKSPAGRD